MSQINEQIRNIKGQNITNEIFCEHIKCDYTVKYNYMLYNNIQACDINALIMLFNYCFYSQNNFFNPTLTNYSITMLYKMYNKMKTNILDNTQYDLFFAIEPKSLKCLKYILSNILTNKDIIMEENQILFENITIDSLQKMHKFITLLIDKKY